MLLDTLVAASAAVAGTAGRHAKISQIAGLLAAVPPEEVPIAVAFLSGELTQRQIGVGYAALVELIHPDCAQRPTLTLAQTDEAFGAIGALAGAGSQGQRRQLLAGLLSRATRAEREFLVRLLAGDLGQGALEGVMTDAVASAAGVPADLVRRAHQLGGSLPEVARAALGSGDPQQAAAALRSFTLVVGRPIRPMLASPAASISAALSKISPAALEWKIDGIRIQVHRQGSEVTVFTRTLEDITARLPEIVRAALSLDVTSVVLDAEAVALLPDGRPRPFQVTAARAASQADVARLSELTPLTPFLFDLLHLNGADAIDAPGSERHRMLAAIAPPELLIPRTVTAEARAAEAFFAATIAAGHEGIVVKSLQAPYGAGRRGSEWIKVKPRHTLDLVVLAAEWGHGRRRGLLSNLHLGARDPATGGLVMLGKTFKGLTDEMLAWQTARLLDLADPPRPPIPAAERAEQHGVVRVRPELVAEIAFDGVQASHRYPGGVALRFARVLRYRPDKNAAQADTIDAVRAVWGPEELADDQ